jgi:metallo-beta-lactamase family protein
MKLTIHGAAQQVTGSMHLLQVGQYKILVDCGLDYEKNAAYNRTKIFHLTRRY